MAENFQLERYLSSCGLRGNELPHICLQHPCELISARVLLEMLRFCQLEIILFMLTSPNTRNYTYTSMQIRLTDLQLNNSVCQCLIFYPYPLLTLFFPCFCGGCCCCFEPWWSWSCGEESDVWSGLDLCSALAVVEAVLLAPGQAGRPLQPGPSSSMGGSKSDKEAQSLRVCACVCVCVCVCVRVVL